MSGCHRTLGWLIKSEKSVNLSLTSVPHQAETSTHVTGSRTSFLRSPYIHKQQYQFAYVQYNGETSKTTTMISCPYLNYVVDSSLMVRVYEQS